MTKKLYKYIAPLVIVGLVFFVFPKTAEAAIAFDAFTDSGATTNSFSHTSTGSDLVLIVGAAYGDGAPSITGITYNSIALTKIRRDVDAVTDLATELWYLKAPATGANTVAVTYTANPTIRRHWAMTLTGIDQTTPLDAQNGGIGTATTISTAVTTVANNAWVVDSVLIDSNEGYTVGAGQTERLNAVQSFITFMASHEGPKTPAGAVTMSWTGNAPGDPWVISAASFAPVAEEEAAAIVPSRVDIKGEVVITGAVSI